MKKYYWNTISLESIILDLPFDFQQKQYRRSTINSLTRFDFAYTTISSLKCIYMFSFSLFFYLHFKITL